MTWKSLRKKEARQMSNSMTPQYDTILFTDVWDDVAEFKSDFAASPFTGSIKATTPDNVSIVFYLLYARYGNNPIANNDVDQWKMKIFSVIYQYGPSWEKRLDIQAKLRALSENDLRKGSEAVHNHANNPSTSPSTYDDGHLAYINDQNVTLYQKPKMEAYAQLWDLIDTDVTEEFIQRFKNCFKTFVAPEKPLLFVSESEEED